jgi:predicted signal transduction protein with EAL and GGDEF domain
MRDANEHLDMPEFRLGASVGTALYPADAASPEGLIAVADRRLGEAKAGGRGRAITV